MSATQNLPIYVVQNADGEYEIHAEGFDEAIERFEENFSGPIVAMYKIDFIVPAPSEVKPIRIEAKLNQPRSIPEAFGNVAEVKVYDDD